MPLARQGNHLMTTVTTGWSPDVAYVQSCAFLLSLASSARRIFFFFSDSHHVSAGEVGPLCVDLLPAVCLPPDGHFGRLPF